MKKVLVALVVGIVLFGVCSAQSLNAQQNANIAQKIIGTWVDSQGVTWIFNANGNLKWGNTEYKFGITDTKLAIVGAERYGTRDGQVKSFDISISPDGKTLILFAPGSADYWLTKK